MSLIVFMALKEAWCPVQRRHLETAYKECTGHYYRAAHLIRLWRKHQ